jgi:hypothetical protein
MVQMANLNWQTVSKPLRVTVSYPKYTLAELAQIWASATWEKAIFN